MPNRLIIDKLVSVGAVDAGDDPEATIMFWKRRFTSEQAGAKGKQNPDRVRTSKGMPMTDFDLTALADEDREAVEAHIAGLQTRITELEAEPVVEEVEVEKELPDEVKELIAKANERADALQSQLDDEVSKRRDAEYVAKAEEFGFLGAASDVGPVLRLLADAAPEATDQLIGWLAAVGQRVDFTKLFGELGENDDDAADPLAKRDAFVAKYRAENPDATVEKARAAFWREHPDEADSLRENV